MSPLTLASPSPSHHYYCCCRAGITLAFPPPPLARRCVAAGTVIVVVLLLVLPSRLPSHRCHYCSPHCVAATVAAAGVTVASLLLVTLFPSPCCCAITITYGGMCQRRDHRSLRGQH
jgi:hypothetical protein